MVILAFPLTVMFLGFALARHFKRKGREDSANYTMVLTIIVVLLYVRMMWEALLAPFRGGL